VQVRRSRLTADRLVANGASGVGAASRAQRRLTNHLRGIARDVRQSARVRADFLVFQRPGRLGAIDLLHVRDAGIALRGFASLDEVRDRNRGQQTDDRDHDHDFHQREGALARCLELHMLPF
jgi:hypothetical protein